MTLRRIVLQRSIRYEFSLVTLPFSPYPLPLTWFSNFFLRAISLFFPFSPFGIHSTQIWNGVTGRGSEQRNGWKFRALYSFYLDNTRVVGEIRGDTRKIVDKLLTRYTVHGRSDGRSRIIGKHWSRARENEKSSTAWDDSFVIFQDKGDNYSRGELWFYWHGLVFSPDRLSSFFITIYSVLFYRHNLCDGSVRK